MEVGKFLRARIVTVLAVEQALAISAARLASAALETLTIQIQVAQLICLQLFLHLERLVLFVFLIPRNDFILIFLTLAGKVTN